MNKKAERAFEIISDKRYNLRTKALQRADERGFALLTKFAQLEACLKLLRFWYFCKDGWPDQLDFVDARWSPLRDLRNLNPAGYALLIGVGGRSLTGTRNRIAHEACNLTPDEYSMLAQVADWAVSELQRRLPTPPELRAKVSRIKRRRSVKG